jgi:hypothetical protein
MSFCTILEYLFNVLLTYEKNYDIIRYFVAYPFPETDKFPKE